MEKLHALLLPRYQIVYEGKTFYSGRLITGFSHVPTLLKSRLNASSLQCCPRVLSVEGLRGSNQHSGRSNSEVNAQDKAVNIQGVSAYRDPHVRAGRNCELYST
jgi:hypothetical protein